MKLLKSLILLSIVVILGFLAYFFVYKADIAQDELNAHEKMLVRFDIDNISKFVLVHEDSSIVFERGVGRFWYITAPINTDAEKEVLFNLFNALHTSEILFTISENPNDLSPYGLSTPETYMSMTYDNAEPDTIFIGRTTPDGTMSYIRFASEMRVLSIDKSLADRMKRDLRYYRSRTALNIISTDITAVGILRGDDDQISIANTGYSWIMSAPWDMNGDAHNMKEVATAVSEITIKAIAEEKTDDLAKYGLDNPHAILTISLKYGMPERMLLIGDEMKVEGQLAMRFMKVFDRDAIIVADNNIFTTLTRIPEWFIEKNPITIFRERVNKIVLDTRGNTVTIVKDRQSNWFVTDPIDKNVNIETINKIWGLTSSILLQSMHSYAPTDEDISNAGFDNPLATISLYENDTLLDGTIFGDTYTTDEPNTYYMTMKKPSIYISRAQVNADINKILNAVFTE